MSRRDGEIIPDFSIRETILMGSFARADGIREIPPLVAELFPSHERSRQQWRRVLRRFTARRIAAP
nr:MULTISPECIES: hypothetical protein [unclassified Bradyrhizobium]